MGHSFNILAISGSTRKNSSNLQLIKAIADLTTERFSITIYDGLTNLPQFNPDIDNEQNAPSEVTDFRNLLQKADGVLICTPEYAIGVPGALKNAIDWTVSSMEFSKKPVALITASLSGAVAHKSLLGTLLIIESKITTDTQLLISYIKTKLNEEGVITDMETLRKIKLLIQSLIELMHYTDASSLSSPILMHAGVNNEKS